MWHDNETDIDLLGFEYLADALEVVLREPRLLPVTVGVMGDWGSGKSSLLTMAARRLQLDEGFVVVPFSPWRYEGQDDVKTALMANVLERLVTRAHDDPTQWEKVKSHLPALASDLRGLVRTASALGTAGAAVAGVPIEAATMVGSAAEALASTFDQADTAEPDARL